MAKKGKLSTSKADKANFASYKLENRVEKNKIKKLERHCKKFPNDKMSAESLARIKKSGYKPRSKPLVPGSNPTIPKVKYRPAPGYLHLPMTAGEQLSVLLGIPLRSTRSKRKPDKAPIRYKKKKNVST